MYNGLFFALLAFCIELPPPFCSFENLYFKAESATFLTDQLPLKTAIDPGEKRGYVLKLLDEPLRNSERVSGTVFFLFESRATRKYLAHFFHLLEHICALWSFYGNEHFQDVHRIILAADGDPENWQWEGPN